MKRILTTTAIVALITGAVAADGVTFGQLSIDRTNFSASGDDRDVTEFNGEIEYRTGDIFVSGAAENTSAEANNAEGDVRELSVAGGYFITPDVLIGLTAINIDANDDDETLAGAFAQYDNGQIGAGIRILQNLDSDDTLYLGVGTYQAAPGVELGVALTSSNDADGTRYVISADYDQGPIDARAFVAGDTEVDGSIFGVRGAYEFAGAFRGTASLENASSDDGDVFSYNVGAGYKIADGAWIDVAVGQVDFDGGETYDTLSLSLSFETGTQTRLDRAFERDLREDFRNGARLFPATSF